MESIIFHTSLLLGQQEMIVGDFSQVGKLKIIEAYGKVLGQKLPYRRIDDPKRFSATWRPQYYDASERIYIDIPIVYFLFKIKEHGNIDRCRRIQPFRILHKRFCFDVPFILSKAGVDELRDIINSGKC